MDYANFKNFLKLFQYGIDDSKKTESINYIIEIMKKSEELNKTLTFDKLGEVDYSPNLCLDHRGNLYFDTQKIKELYEAYLKSVKYVKTEVAQIEHERFLTMHDIAAKPIIFVNKDE